MKKIAHITLSVLITCSLAACGGKSEDLKEEEVEKADNPLEALQNMAEETNNAQKEADKKIADRRAKGDTLALHYEELMKYLPGDIAGYKRGEPDGASMNQPGSSFSSANVTYTNDKNEEIRVTIIDYNQAYGIYTAATAMWAMGITVDTPEEKSQGLKFDNGIGGWEQFQKKSGNTVVTLGVGYRFWVQVEAEAQKDTENAKNIAKMIDLKKLAEM
jgi:hypothetical protein